MDLTGITDDVLQAELARRKALAKMDRAKELNSAWYYFVGEKFDLEEGNFALCHKRYHHFFDSWYSGGIGPFVLPPECANLQESEYEYGDGVEDMLNEYHFTEAPELRKGRAQSSNGQSLIITALSAQEVLLYGAFVNPLLEKDVWKNEYLKLHEEFATESNLTLVHEASRGRLSFSIMPQEFYKALPLVAEDNEMYSDFARVQIING